MTTWGVDPGLRGSAASASDGCCVVVPLADFAPAAGDVVYIEEPLQVTGQSARGNATAQRNYGVLLDLCRRAGARVVEVHPRTWQAACRLSAGRGEPKREHKRRMAGVLRRCFAAVDGGKADDLDAAGILLYGLAREMTCD